MLRHLCILLLSHTSYLVLSADEEKSKACKEFVLDNAEKLSSKPKRTDNLGFYRIFDTGKSYRQEIGKNYIVLDKDNKTWKMKNTTLFLGSDDPCGKDTQIDQQQVGKIQIIKSPESYCSDKLTITIKKSYSAPADDPCKPEVGKINGTYNVLEKETNDGRKIYKKADGEALLVFMESTWNLISHAGCQVGIQHDNWGSVCPENTLEALKKDTKNNLSITKFEEPSTDRSGSKEVKPQTTAKKEETPTTTTEKAEASAGKVSSSTTVSPPEKTSPTSESTSTKSIQKDAGVTETEAKTSVPTTSPENLTKETKIVTTVQSPVETTQKPLESSSSSETTIETASQSDPPEAVNESESSGASTSTIVLSLLFTIVLLALIAIFVKRVRRNWKFGLTGKQLIVGSIIDNESNSAYNSF